MSNKNNKGNENNNTLLIICMFLGIILIAVFAFLGYKMYSKNSEEKELAYTKIITELNEQKIEKIEMTAGSSSITVTYKGAGKEEDRQKQVLVPSIQAFMELVQEKVDKEDKKESEVKNEK